MRQNEFSKKIKVLAFQKAGGKCSVCLIRITGGAEYDHIIPIGLGGEGTIENCQVCCTKCHSLKTKGDVKAIAKAKRIEAKHLGRPKSKWPSRPMRQERYDNSKQIHEVDFDT